MKLLLSILVLLVVPTHSIACSAVSTEQAAYSQLQIASIQYREAKRAEELQKLLADINLRRK